MRPVAIAESISQGTEGCRPGRAIIVQVGYPGFGNDVFIIGAQLSVKVSLWVTGIMGQRPRSETVDTIDRLAGDRRDRPAVPAAGSQVNQCGGRVVIYRYFIGDITDQQVTGPPEILPVDIACVEHDIKAMSGSAGRIPEKRRKTCRGGSGEVPKRSMPRFV